MKTMITGLNRRRFLLAIAIVLSCALSAFSQRRERVIDTWRPLHYDVALVFDEKLSQLERAKTEISGVILKDNVEAIDLDFGAMEIDSVVTGNRQAQFERKPGELLIVSLGRTTRVGDKFTITITYHGRPTDGLIFATDRDGKPSATGDNWPNRVHQWIPCLDHPSAKATVSFSVSAPPREIVVANGKFVTMTRNGSAPTLWRFEEKKPIPAYCMVVAVSEGAKLDATGPTVTPLSYYIPQKDRAYAPKGFSMAAPALAFFSTTIAPYPYEKLALIVGATRFGGMENSSAIVFTNTLFDPRNDEKMSKRFGVPDRIESVVAHEIAHQWFGDSVTASTWADLWLSEGFATYFAGLFIEKYDGREAFREYMRGAAESYFNYEQQRNTPIHDTETQDLMKLLNANNYEKGSWVLHMLRSRLGDEPFFRGLRAYYNAHRDGNATTEDLRKALEKSSGKDLREFFTRWIYGSGHPVYELGWGSMERRAATSVVINLKQIQDGEAFLDPVPVEFTVRGRKQRRTIYPTGKVTTQTIRLGGKPTTVKIDPDDTLLKEAITKP
jgi:aminopeptidase N